MICCPYFLVFLQKRSESQVQLRRHTVNDTSGKWMFAKKKKKKKDVGPSAERWATPLKWVYKKNKKNVFSSLSFGLNHYLVVVLLHFSILSICHCSWVVMERHRSVMSLFVSDLFIIHPLHLLPPILFLVLLQFTKTRLHKKQFPLNHRHCGMKIFLSY